MKDTEWWNNDGGFFGRNYMLGDNSMQGYLPGVHESLHQRTQRECEGVINLLNLPGHARILDVPCGYGRHSKYLAQRGYTVTGVDINDDHLSRAMKNGGEATFLQGDMRNLSQNNGFDAVINMFYSFGFFASDEENAQVMQQFYDTLVKGGRLLLHTDVSPEIIAAGNYKLHERRQISENAYVDIREHYDTLTKRMEGSWTLETSTGKEQLTPYSVRIYSEDEFRQLAVDVGFSRVEFFGDFNGSAFSKDSLEMILVAEK